MGYASYVDDRHAGLTIIMLQAKSAINRLTGIGRPTMWSVSCVQRTTNQRSEVVTHKFAAEVRVLASGNRASVNKRSRMSHRSEIIMVILLWWRPHHSIKARGQP
jgi:hypothetical protein